MGPERRKHEREDVEFVLKYRCNSDEDFEYTYYQNISLGGVYVIELPNRLKRGVVLELEFLAPSTPNHSPNKIDAIHLYSKVVYCRRNKSKPDTFDCGIEFVDLSEESVAAVSKFLEQIKHLKQIKAKQAE